MRKYAVGIDIGGSHISAVLINTQSREVLKESFAEQDINNKADATDIFSRWADTIKEAASRVDISELKGIGFAMPGPFDYEKGIALFEKVNKYESLYGKDVGLELRNILQYPEDVSFRFINDATAFAIGEAWIGKSKDVRRSVALTLGTGFGSAYIEDGIPAMTGDGVPEMGCLWHLPYKDGIADDYFSTRWFVNNYKSLSGKVVKGVKEIANAAEEGEEAALSLFREYGSGLGHFLAPSVRQFHPGMLVIGGNITGAWHLFGQHLEKAFANNNIRISIELSSLKESAAMIGSGRLINDSYFEKIKPLIPLM